MDIMVLNKYIITFFVIIGLFGCGKENQIKVIQQKPKFVKFNKQYISSEPSLASNIPFKSNIDTTSLPYMFIANINRIRMSSLTCSKPVSSLLYNRKLEFAAKSYPMSSVDTFLNSNVSINKSNTSFLQRIKDFGYIVKPNRAIGELLAFSKYTVTKSSDIKINFKHALDNLIQNPDSCKLLMNPKFKDVGVAFKRTNLGYYWIIELAGGEN